MADRYTVFRDGTGSLRKLAQRTFSGSPPSASASTDLLVSYMALEPTENHAGEVGFAAAAVAATPTVDTSIYASGDLVGGKLTFASAARVAAGSGEILAVNLTDKAGQAADLDLVLFKADPTGTTFTDQAAFTVADADLDKIIGVIKLRTADWTAFADNAVAHQQCRIPFKLASGQALYGAIVSRGTPTYASAADVTATLGIHQN